jgi:hypothetical protein
MINRNKAQQHRATAAAVPAGTTHLSLSVDSSSTSTLMMMCKPAATLHERFINKPGPGAK